MRHAEEDSSTVRRFGNADASPSAARRTSEEEGWRACGNGSIGHRHQVCRSMRGSQPEYGRQVAGRLGHMPARAPAAARVGWWRREARRPAEMPRLPGPTRHRIHSTCVVGWKEAEHHGTTREWHRQYG